MNELEPPLTLDYAWTLHAEGKRREAERLSKDLLQKAISASDDDKRWPAQILVLYCEAERSPPPGIAGRAQSLARRCKRAGRTDDAVRGLLLAAEFSAKRRRASLLAEAESLLDNVRSANVKLAHAHAVARTALVEGRPAVAQRALKKVSREAKRAASAVAAEHRALRAREAKAPRGADEPAGPRDAHPRLLAMTLALSQQRDPEQLFGMVARAVEDLLDVDRAVVLMVQDGEPVVVAQHPLLARPISDPIIAQVIAERDEVLVEDIALAEGASSASILGLGVTSVLCVPMLLGNEVVGVLYADARNVANNALGEQAWVLRSLAAHAAVAVGNARMLGEQAQRVREGHELAHDVRSVLSAVLGAAELLTELGPSEAQKPMVDLIETATKALVAQVTEALAPEPAAMAPVDLAELAAQAVGMLAIEAAAEDKHFNLKTTGSCIVLARQQDLLRATVNLLTNALKYGPAGKDIDVTVKATTKRVTLAVRDRGPGIPEQSLGRVFDSGFQAEGAEAGHGLGLGMVRRVIADCGGTIEAKNAKGGGARVQLAIPPHA
ncbi:MAG: HAMP domain-containing histidine kinase [Proteobacteria bacterium]|nr:HAMP domain-containing histidine kinase [Pseudomonadota bacterium]